LPAPTLEVHLLDGVVALLGVVVGLDAGGLGGLEALLGVAVAGGAGADRRVDGVLEEGAERDELALLGHGVSSSAPNRGRIEGIGR